MLPWKKSMGKPPTDGNTNERGFVKTSVLVLHFVRTTNMVMEELTSKFKTLK
jgi:hypothetical protein